MRDLLKVALVAGVSYLLYMSIVFGLMLAGIGPHGRLYAMSRSGGPAEKYDASFASAFFNVGQQCRDVERYLIWPAVLLGSVAVCVRYRSAGTLQSSVLLALPAALTVAKFWSPWVPFWRFPLALFLYSMLAFLARLVITLWGRQRQRRADHLAGS